MAEKRRKQVDCAMCLGTGVVIHLGEERPARRMVKTACPTCSGHSAA
jgi:DnaJ-class molecular chaperone